MMARSDQKFYEVAFHDSPRQESMDREYESLKNNETLVLVSLPLERRDKSTFLHGKLEDQIYMEQPKGYIDDSSLACKMRKPLYRIKKSPRECNSKLNSSILSPRF